MEADEARDIIDEAVERGEERERERESAERAAEKRFRDRASILVGVFAVMLAIVEVAVATSQRNSLRDLIAASDTYSYMQAKIVRETVLTTAAAEPGRADAADLAREAHRLRAPDRAGHGIGQLQHAADEAHERSAAAAERGERYEIAETALQVAIVLLSIALVTRSRPIVGGAIALAAIGALTAIVTALL